MTKLKVALDLALRHSAAQQRRYHLDDPHEQLVLEAAWAFRAMLDDDRLAPLLRDIQKTGRSPPPFASN
jgi:hypothetical protein